MLVVSGAWLSFSSQLTQESNVLKVENVTLKFYLDVHAMKQQDPLDLSSPV